jgi:metallo-beta-lactamase superfamily
MVDIQQYTWDIVGSNSWLILEDKQGMLIDAVENDALFHKLKQLDKVTLILTHCHFDHIIGLNKIREIRDDIRVICTKKCSEYITDIHRNMSAVATIFMQFYEKEKKGGTEIEPFICNKADVVFEDSLDLIWCDKKISLKAVYGHGDDGLIVVLDNEKLFSGDELLSIPTVTRLPRGSSKRFWEEDIPLLKSLKVEDVYPGHGNKEKFESLMRNINV